MALLPLNTVPVAHVNPVVIPWWECYWSADSVAGLVLGTVSVVGAIPANVPGVRIVPVLVSVVHITPGTRFVVHVSTACLSCGCDTATFRFRGCHATGTAIPWLSRHWYTQSVVYTPLALYPWLSRH